MAYFVSGQKYLIFRDPETKYYVKLMLSSTPTGLEIGHKQSFSSTFINIVAPYLRKPPLLLINASGCCEFWEHGKACPEPSLPLKEVYETIASFPFHNDVWVLTEASPRPWESLRDPPC